MISSTCHLDVDFFIKKPIEKWPNEISVGTFSPPQHNHHDQLLLVATYH